MAKKYLIELDVNHNKVTNLGNPTLPLDAVNKDFIDELFIDLLNVGTWSYDDDILTIPSINTFKLNDITPTLATILNISTTDLNSFVADFIFERITYGNIITIQDATDSSIWVKYKINGNVTLNTTYYEIYITNTTSSSTSLINGNPCKILFNENNGGIYSGDGIVPPDTQALIYTTLSFMYGNIGIGITPNGYTKLAIKPNGYTYTDIALSVRDYSDTYNLFTISGDGAVYSSGKCQTLNSTSYGYMTLNSITTGDYNVAFGSYSMQNSTSAGSNVAIGFATLRFNTTGSGNVAIGESVLNNNTTGNQNVVVGVGSLSTNTTGSGNVAVGTAINITGSNNVGVGTLVKQIAGGGDNNVGIGAYVLRYNGGDNNVGIGAYVMSSGASTASNCVVIGYNSGYSLTGNNNTVIGYNSLSNATTATFNTIIGSTAGNTITTASQNVVIGYNAGGPSSGGYNILIGNYATTVNNTDSNSISIGYSVTGNGSNTVTIGNDSIVKHYLHGDIYIKAVSSTSSSLTFQLRDNSNLFDLFNINGNGDAYIYNQLVVDGTNQKIAAQFNASNVTNVASYDNGITAFKSYSKSSLPTPGVTISGATLWITVIDSGGGSNITTLCWWKTGNSKWIDIKTNSPVA